MELSRYNKYGSRTQKKFGNNPNRVAGAMGCVRHPRKVGKVKPSTWPGMEPQGAAIWIQQEPIQKDTTNHKSTEYNLF